MLTDFEAEVVETFHLYEDNFKFCQIHITRRTGKYISYKQINEIVKKYRDLFLPCTLEDLRSKNARSVLDNNEILKYYISKNLTIQIK